MNSTIRLRDGSLVDRAELADLDAKFDQWNRDRCKRAAAALHTAPNNTDGEACGYSPDYPTPATPCPRCGSTGQTRQQLRARGQQQEGAA